MFTLFSMWFCKAILALERLCIWLKVHCYIALLLTSCVIIICSDKRLSYRSMCSQIALSSALFFKLWFSSFIRVNIKLEFFCVSINSIKISA